MRFLLLFFGFSFSLTCIGQYTVSGSVRDAEGPLVGAAVFVKTLQQGTVTDAQGKFTLEIPNSNPQEVTAQYTGFEQQKMEVSASSNTVMFQLKPSAAIQEVVVTGTLREMTKMESPVPVELYRQSFVAKNPVPNLFESLDRVNGVRPQINCNVCNTGDIHINGLEGPYTMVLIDGMPIVSGLSTVYGLSGIPNGILEQMEIVKGPSSAIYGSEALGGVINVITKMPKPEFGGQVDLYGTSWLESNLDVSLNTPINENTSLLTGVNYFQYNNPVDNNNDNITDLTLQNRASVFNKLYIKRPDNKYFSLATRVFYEDRWGGEMQWEPKFAGGDSVYGESIQTERLEAIGKYDLPTLADVSFQFSYNFHRQNSFYGTTSYNATQQIGFGQLLWQESWTNTQLTSGAALRYNYYDDNTPATQNAENLALNAPDIRTVPGLFAQVQHQLGERTRILAGLRADYQTDHGIIYTPRFAVKYNTGDNSTLRLNGGTGFRIVNIFTEDHAALTGARTLVIADDIKPERSASINLNYEQQFYSLAGNRYGFDITSWYTHFSNQIIPDYDSNPNEIRYENLDNYSVSRGVSLNLNAKLISGFSAWIGASYFDVFVVENQNETTVKTQPILTENWTGTYTLSYQKPRGNWSVDYTGNVYGPMRLPLLGELDPRAEFSPWWSIQNLKFTYEIPKHRLSFYGGIKNLLNFTPAANSIARAGDPFDKEVQFDADGNALATSNNPFALTFDPSYVYAPFQGRRLFVGFTLDF